MHHILDTWKNGKEVGLNIAEDNDGSGDSNDDDTHDQPMLQKEPGEIIENDLSSHDNKPQEEENSSLDENSQPKKTHSMNILNH